MPLEQHPTDPDKLVFRALRPSVMYSRDALDAAVAAEREAIIEILANNNPRDNGTATTIYSAPGLEEFDNGWLVAVETKLHAIRARGQT